MTDFFLQMLLFLLSPLLLMLPGVILIYKALANKYKGMMLIVIGTVFVIVSWFIILVILLPELYSSSPSLEMALFSLGIIAGILIFYIPGIYLIVTGLPSINKEFNEKFLAHYSAFVVSLCLYSFILFFIGYGVKAFVAPSITFQEHFFNAFWPSVGFGIVLTFVTVGFLKLTGEL